MKYSVVICSYNKLEYLKRVVEGFRAIEDFDEHEYILSDDFSTDGTLEWADESGFFEHIVGMEDEGEYRLNTIRNQGILAASSDFVVLLDADCVPQPRYFEGHDYVFELDQRRLSVGFTDFFNTEGTKAVNMDHRRPWLKGGNECKIGWMSAYGGNIAIPKKIWNEVGRFDEDFNGAWGLDDAEFAYRAHLAGVDIVMHRHAVVHHLRHPHTGTKQMRQGKGPNTKKFKKKHGFSP